MTNGEKYKTAKERAEAFRKYHDEHHHECRDTLYVGNAIDRCVMCMFNWLDLEAPAEEPLPCPFCGAKMLVCENAYTHRKFCACEKKCGYISQYGDNEHQVVAAHNRVARAAKEKEAK